MYTKEKILKVAKRYNNPKRSYLLVNPYQAKHIPVAPCDAIDMMNALGDVLAARYHSAKLVIGFAETATAIGAAVASRLNGCRYVQTTREGSSCDDDWVYFLEEHSHAKEQKICISALKHALMDTDTVIFVDDEISTGKTLINIVTQISSVIPALKEKRIVVASLINRVSDENLQMLASFGMECVQLLKLQNEDYENEVLGVTVEAPSEAPSMSVPVEKSLIQPLKELQNPRLGVCASEYVNSTNTFVAEIREKLSVALSQSADVLVLGTEECMYPALALGMDIANNYPNCHVVCHATTRSPIGLNEGADYPIKNGYRIHSFYDSSRVNYVYNASAYDVVIVLTDSPCAVDEALDDIVKVFSAHGSRTFFKIGGDADVQHL